MKVVWTEQALARLEAIRDYLAARNPDAAATTLERIIARGHDLASFPRMGRKLPDVSNCSWRELIEPPYRIVYRVRGRTIEILTVFEGHLPLPLRGA